MANPIGTIEGEVKTNSIDINTAEIPVGPEQVANTPRVEQEPDKNPPNETKIGTTSDSTVVKKSYAEIMRETVPDKGVLPQEITSPWVKGIIGKVGDIEKISLGYGSKSTPFSV